MRTRVSCFSFFSPWSGGWVLALLCVCNLSISYGQTAPNHYWIHFAAKDAPQTDYPFSIDRPHEFLAEPALERRDRFNILITEEDLPVNPFYIETVTAIDGVELIHQSRWFNAITVQVSDSNVLQTIQALPFVAETRQVQRLRAEPDHPAVQAEKTLNAFDTAHYGRAYSQISQLNGHLLHAAGFRGEGMQIAVIDAGFNQVFALEALSTARDDGRLLSAFDYVDNDASIDHSSNHGTHVLTTMAANWPGQLVGTAPAATYHLFRTEAVAFEYVIEEDYWIAAAEQADQMGIDLINSSLGYSEFDDSTQNYLTSEMNGEVSRISRAATIAASKGMLVVTSAGNRGASDWRIITAPGDARDILTVGAVDSLGVHAFFSSFGPTADGRIKPDVMAQGRASSFVSVDGNLTRGNGTSFSSPILCGLAACLWQAHPNRSAAEIRQAIIESAHLYLAPNDSMGYGIPNFWTAHQRLRGRYDRTADALVYPNPARDMVYVEWQTEGSLLSCPKWQLFTATGQLLAQGELNAVGDRALGNFGLPAGCTSGTYVLELTWGGMRAVQRVIVDKTMP